jgi:plasmid replication initiation protein
MSSTYLIQQKLHSKATYILIPKINSFVVMCFTFKGGDTNCEIKIRLRELTNRMASSGQKTYNGQ